MAPLHRLYCLLRSFIFEKTRTLEGEHVQTCRFSIGQIVQHRKFGYRGVVADVDPVFSGTDEWYEIMARSRPPRNAPWYTVLVDGRDHVTYVAERHLAEDTTGEQIEHPALGRFFDRFDGQGYRTRRSN